MTGGVVDLATVKHRRDEQGRVILSVVVGGKIIDLVLTRQKVAAIAGLLLAALAEDVSPPSQT